MREILLHLDPKPQARARLGRGRVYDPSAAHKKAAAILAKIQWDGGLLSGPLELHLEFGLLGGKQRVENEWHIKRPDLSNLIKLIEDALIGIVYDDDAIICKIVAKKVYTKTPYTKIQVYELKADP
jgi:Holliday junction resolvase RusA-like endonuclease